MSDLTDVVDRLTETADAVLLLGAVDVLADAPVEDFVGKGLMEFVEGKIFVPTKIEGFPTIEWLGIYPYYESLVPQAIMIAALIIGVIIMKNKQAKEA